MRNTRIALCSAALLCVSLSFASFVRADDAVATPLAQPQPDANTNTNYDLDPIVVNYQQYKIGDNLPEQYLDKFYTIVEWQKRHLPAPQENTHWAYINANYILITNDSAKIVQAKSGEIFFRG
ncbi:hypothetical protein SODG_006132 [Sodalis praecaptivus]|uniref:RcnB family protein n=1 Tax=Sodalis praecaptivus TaxID=1239307 RepID=UPI0027EE03A7|nr:RcnB family protein [Sodalis praecaptivus]CAJ0995167.1 hypothetical protein NVIRENTERO_01781 [Sodalis praecaptivus]